jgi:FAD/FMN-containing dehydrogenase
VNRQRRKLAAAARGEDPSGWAREFWEAMRPHASGVGGYVNFMSEIDEDARLARIKGEWDPDNVFHLNANIKPG